MNLAIWSTYELQSCFALVQRREFTEVRLALITPKRLLILLAFALLLASNPRSASAYSVLTHQAIIDSVWEDSIEPILNRRFPGTTAEELRLAKAHAYGGAIIQDIGYYPFGNKLFTNLTHYVRSGDFIEALIAEARDRNELAFALGALAHYAADSSGHSIGTNRAVPIIYPELRAKYGDEVTYAEHPSSHIKAEFGFDVLQVARGRYAPEEYHDFIGFKVSEDVMKRAFQRVYCLELKEVFVSLDLAIATYRKAVSDTLPQLTRVAWEMKKDEIEKAAPGITSEKFIYNISRSDYEKEFGHEYEKPSFTSKLMAAVLRVLPKIGLLKGFAFKVPPPEAEELFLQSVDDTISRYRQLLARADGKLDLPNVDFDTGRPTHAGEYPLADETYADLLKKLGKRNFEGISTETRENILTFYSNMDAPIATKKDKSDWRDTMRELERLKSFRTVEVVRR